MTKLPPDEELDLSGDAAFALEAQLLERVSSGQSPFEIAIWQTERCLVVSQAFTRNARFNEAAEKSHSEDWPVFTRCTGGDVTPQGAGTLNVTLAYRLAPDSAPSIDAHYDLLCRPISEHLTAWDQEPGFSAIPHSFCDGAHNLSVNGRKMVGTAQRWRRIRDGSGAHMVFSHALILVDADLCNGIAATNALYESCGLEHRVRGDVHINLSEVSAAKQGRGVEVPEYAAYLRAAYERILGDVP